MPTSSTVGFGEYLYRPVPSWPSNLDNLGLHEAIGVAVDESNRLVVFNRGEPAVFVFQSDGTFVESWGQGQFVRPHGISMSQRGTLLVVDDLGHRVAEYSTDGNWLRDIGPAGNPVATGVDGFDYRTIGTGHGPYNLPTNVAETEDNHLFVADGYGNARIHHFLPDGTLEASWGEPGSEPGQFNVPHGICADSVGRVLVADRENSRIQIFDQTGEFLGEWLDVIRPCQIIESRDGVFLVAELGNQNGRFPWQKVPDQPTGGRISVFDRDGNLLSRWGGGLDAQQPDAFFACHDIAEDDQGNLYVGEVAMTAAAAAGLDASHLPKLRKFERI